MKLCAIGIHKWTLWETTGEGDITAACKTREGIRRIGSWRLQTRKCTDCGLVQDRQDQIRNE